jgi:lipopolysaccharide biosynthesis glycosyltransferase
MNADTTIRIEIPIVFSTDKNYVPYLSVAVQSVMENAAEENRYRIYVLHARNISESSIEKLKTQVGSFRQFSIEFIDISQRIKNVEMTCAEHLSVAAYFRLLIPYIFPKYKKVLYLDCDLVCLGDIAELYQMNLNGYLLAAAKDRGVINCWYKPPHIDKNECDLDGISRIKNPANYFNSGVLLFNTDEFRQFISVEKLLELAASRRWVYADQDVLNVLCEDHIKNLSSVWNFTNTNVVPYAPDDIQKDYAASQKNPKIIHYLLKPLISHFVWDTDEGYGPVFWKYACSTPFIDSIAAAMTRQGFLRPVITSNKIKKQVFENIQNGSFGMRFILKCARLWFAKKIKKK